MIQVNTHAAKTNLSALLFKVENSGEQVTICRNGRPVALLSPFRRLKRKNRGAIAAQVIAGMKSKATTRLSTDEIMAFTRR